MTVFANVFAILGVEVRGIANGFLRASWRDVRGQLLLLVLALLFVVGLERGAERIFRRLLFELPAPDLGPPLVARLIETAHVLFFALLAISTLSAMLSALYLDREVAFLLGAPVSLGAIWTSRFLIGGARASWFVVLADLPLLYAYGQVRDATWGYYPAAAILVLLFLIAPISLGAAGAMLVVRFVPAQRAKETLTILAVVGISAALVGMRLMEPERFFRPEVIYGDPEATLAEIGRPAAPWLSAAPLARALAAWARPGVAPSATGAVVLWALGAFAAAALVARWVYWAGIRQTTGTPFLPARRKEGRLWTPIRRLLRPESAETIVKDVTLFWRDPTQWSQLIVLVALVVIYVFNFRQLGEQMPSTFVRDLVAFLNIGMAGFVLVAVANRFVFSSISLEGRAFWAVRTAPVELVRVVLAKGIVAFVPLLLLAEAITLLTYHALGVSRQFVWVAAGAIFAMTVAVTALGLGLGMLAPRFDSRDPAEIGMSPAGLLFIAAGLAYVGLFLSLLATPVVLRYFSRFFLFEVPPLRLYGPAALAVVLHLVVILLPFTWGLARLERTAV